jgi:hypothetical protein
MSWAQERREQFRKKIRKAALGQIFSRTDVVCTAVHESAHCVFNEGFGLSTEWVTCYPSIQEGEKALGFTKSREGGVVSGPQSLIGTLSGDIAEFPLINGRPYTFNGWMTNSDLDSVGRTFLAAGMTFSSVEEGVEIIRRHAEQAAQLVDELRPFIEAVALELYAHKTIQGDRVRDILTKMDFFTIKNPLFYFCIYSRMMRILAIAAQNGLSLPPWDLQSPDSTKELLQWLAANNTALMPLLLDHQAPWNKRVWGDGRPDEQLSETEIEEIINCHDVLRRFGIDPTMAIATAA